MAPGLQSRNRSRRLSTGQVARLLSVTPDTVLKWIKSGRLPAVRTAGGHYRVAEDDVDRLISTESGRRPPDVGGFLYCWEYYAGRHEPSESCQDCLVYRARARRCYEMSGLAREVGYSGTYCTNSCMECSYYREVVQRSRRVLVVTESADLRRRLELESSDSRLEVAFANSEYECSAACNDFRPEYVVIDGSLSRQVRASLCSHLAVDPRIPGVQIILAVTADTRSGSTEYGCGVDRVIPREFELEDLEQHIIGLEVEPATTA